MGPDAEKEAWGHSGSPGGIPTIEVNEGEPVSKAGGSCGKPFRTRRSRGQLETDPRAHNGDLSTVRMNPVQRSWLTLHFPWCVVHPAGPHAFRKGGCVVG